MGRPCRQRSVSPVTDRSSAQPEAYASRRRLATRLTRARTTTTRQLHGTLLSVPLSAVATLWQSMGEAKRVRRSCESVLSATLDIPSKRAPVAPSYKPSDHPYKRLARRDTWWISMRRRLARRLLGRVAGPHRQLPDGLRDQRQRARRLRPSHRPLDLCPVVDARTTRTGSQDRF